MTVGANEFTWFSGATPAEGTYVYPDLTGQELRNIAALAVSAEFVAGTGGTSVNIYVQTSIDGGTKWIDVAEFSLTTSDARKAASVRYNVTSGSAPVTLTDGGMSANAVQEGIVGGRWRAKVVVVGSYATSTLSLRGTCVRSAR